MRPVSPNFLPTGLQIARSAYEAGSIISALLLSNLCPRFYPKLTRSKEANPNAVDKPKPLTGLMIAIKHDDEKMFDLLIKHGADPALIVGDDHKVSALHHAATENKIHFARKLVDLKVDVNISTLDEGIWSPLHEAALHGSEELIGFLLDQGADIEAMTATKATPLALAARHYRMVASRYLLKRGANVNTQDKAGSTPLIQACLVGATSVAKLLVEVGKADLSIKNAAGATALDEADRKDMWECALYVWSVGCESGAFKTAKGLGPVKWTRPRVLGFPSYKKGPTPNSYTQIDAADVTDASDSASTRTATTSTTATDAASSNGPKGSKGAHFSSPPAPRYGAAMTSIGSSVFFFGGVGYPDGVADYNPDQSFRDNESEPIELHTHTGFYRLNVDNLKYRSLLPSNVRKVPASTFKLNAQRAPPLAMIDSDGVTVTCIDEDEESAPMSLSAATPFRKEDGFSYFEVEVINAGTRGISAVGLVGADYAMDKMPGWEPESIGYHADDACAFHNTGWGRQWGKRYSDGDVVGCGILWETGEVFYTLNGEFLGVAFRSPLVEEYYASVGFRNAQAKLKLNFGAVPFLFDFRAPSIQWERLPSSSQEFSGHYPFYMFNIGGDKQNANHGGSIVLLGNGQTNAQGKYWVFSHDKWFSCQADGEQPFVFGDFSYTALRDAIYVFIHSGNEDLKQIYPQQPVLLRLQFKTQEEVDTNVSSLYDEEGDEEPLKGETPISSATAQSSSDAVPSTSDSAEDPKTPKKISPLDASWQQLFPKPASFTLPQDRLDNWFNALKVLEKEFSTATMVGVEGQLCFIGKTALALLNPETFEISVKQYEGAVPPVDKFTTVVVGHHIETFGGWDQHSQRNEVNILDTRNAVWYPPHVLGISPRPRNHHAAASARISSPKHLREIVAGGIETAEPRTEEEFSSTCIVHAYGWNGCNYIDDVEVLSLQNKEDANTLIQLLKPIERQEAGIVNFKVTAFDGTIRWLSTNAIVIAARASKWRQQLIDAPRDSAVTIDISNAPWHLFLAFITFLHDDLADFEVDRDGARLFCRIVENYAPEHSKRVVEALVLTRLNIRSRIAEDMEWAFEHEAFSDISFKVLENSDGFGNVDGNSMDLTPSFKTIKAHKCILMARSAYFQSLLAGGLAESSSDEININDADSTAFHMVLQYLYTQSLDLERVSECITEVFMLACKYAITDLKLKLEAIISYNLSAENAVSLLLLADSYQADGLKKTCAKFIASNYDDVLSTEDYAPNAELVFAFITPYLEKAHSP